MMIEQQCFSNSETAGIALRLGRMWLWARIWIAASFMLAAAGCAVSQAGPSRR